MNARDVVTNRIALQARRFPELDFSPLDTTGLDSRDAGLANAIEHAIHRRWLTLATVIESQLERPWTEVETKLQAALLCGAAQLLLLDRLPDHAVINETVEWTKQNLRAKAGGLVNAVLRKIAALRREIRPAHDGKTQWGRDELPLHDGRDWHLNAPIFDVDPIRRLAQQTSHPNSPITHWLTTHGQKQTTAIALHNLVHAPIIVHGVDANASADAPLLTPHQEPGFFLFNADREASGSGVALSEFLASHPDAIVQDPTSAAAARATVGLSPPPQTIIDACAGMGTKTRQLAQLHPNARIIASDIDDGRMKSLHTQFSGHDRVQVIAYRDLRRFHSQADLLLLDVPCSNTGVLARRVEAKYRFSKANQQKLIDLQRQIIADSLTLLSDRGSIVYSTCSIEAAENEQQAQWLTKWHSFKVAQSVSRLPAGRPGDSPTHYADGGYFAVLQRLQK